ncbi:MAG: ClpXP protease specificity-enhancing factor [Gammaproteobacteria bacterium]
MTSNRPYVLRALHEWILDNGMTPYILVNAEVPDVVVPREYVNEGKVVLNVAPRAVKNLHISNDFVSFSARFSGAPFEVHVPQNAVLAIYARENGKGMIFPEEETGSETEKKQTSDTEEKKPHLKVIK